MRDRGFEWLREQIEKEFDDILAHGGIVWPEMVPEGFGGYQSQPQPLGNGALLPVVSSGGNNAPQDSAWRETNVRTQKQAGYAAVTVQSGAGKSHRRSVARAGADCQHCRRRPGARHHRSEPAAGVHSAGPSGAVHAALNAAGLGESGANEIEDVITCPGAYSCNLGLTKTMNLGAALARIRPPL